MTIFTPSPAYRNDSTWVLSKTTFFIFYLYLTGIKLNILFLSATFGTAVYLLLGALIGIIIYNLRKPKFAKIFAIIVILVIVIFATQSFIEKSTFSKIGCPDRDILCVAGKSIINNDPKLCKHARGEKACLETVAFLQKDEKVCELIKVLPEDTINTIIEREDCYESVAYAKLDPTICNNIPNHHIQACKDKTKLYQEAVDKLDHTLCNRGFSATGSCRGTIAVLKNDPSVCGSNRYSYFRDCIVTFAKANKDISICEKVKHRNWKVLCLDVAK